MSKIIYGIHAVQALIKRAPHIIRTVYIIQKRYNSSRLQSIIHELNRSGIMIQLTNNQWLSKTFEKDFDKDIVIHQGIVAIVKEEQYFPESALPTILAKHANPLLLILDGVTDPQNLGACLRCADASGVDGVIVPRHRSAPLNATVKKIASGAAETVPLIRVTNLSRTLRFLHQHNIWIVGTVTFKTARILYKSKLIGPLALVIGAEDSGIRRLTSEHCDELINIPMAGSVSSLNLSVAAGICLFEAVRQRTRTSNHRFNEII